MNIHKNARLTFEGRKLLIGRIVELGLHAAAVGAGVSERTARKWLARYRVEGPSGLLDRSSRPHRVRASLTLEQRNQAVVLRNERITIRGIAECVRAPVSTLRRWLASQGLNRLPPRDPPPPVRRYEHAAPGDLLHLDIKKLGRTLRPSHRVTGDRRDTVEGAGWEFVHVKNRGQSTALRKVRPEKVYSDPCSRFSGPCSHYRSPTPALDITFADREEIRIR